MRTRVTGPVTLLGVAAATMGMTAAVAMPAVATPPSPSLADRPSVSQAVDVSTSVAARCKRGVRLPSRVDPRACGGLPKGAKPVRTFYRSPYSTTGIIKLPSGLTGCEFDSHGVGCGSHALLSKPLRRDSIGDPYWWTSIGAKGKAWYGPRGDAPVYEYNQPRPQVVPYGQVVYRGSYACLSTKSGATCWNTKTGHGFLIGSKRVATW